MNEARPPADAGCEQIAAQLFSEGLSPEQYAARFAHCWYCFSLGEYRYRSPHVDAWMRRLNDILFGLNGAPSPRELRASLLSPEEQLRIEQEIEDGI